MADVASRFAHASTTGLTLEIGPGVEVRFRDRRDADDYQLGGICVECFAGSSGMDGEGEYFEHPASFVVFDLVTRRWYRVAEPDVDPASIRACESSELRKAILILATDLVRRHTPGGRGRRPRSGLFSSEDVDAIRYMGALVKVLSGNVAPVEVCRPRREESDEF